MRVAIVDYGSGNLQSAAKAFERAAREANIAAEIQVTADPARVARADRVVLPGVGAFADCKAGLEALSGMTDALTEVAITRARPFIGICVGMQLMATGSLEHGWHAGLGWIAGEVIGIKPGRGPSGEPLKVPHMGWNELMIREPPHPILAGLGDGDHLYFVHSYHMVPESEANIRATTDYGRSLTAAIGRDNLFGTQFHPEKSQAKGLRLIGNFLTWEPRG